MGAQRRLTVRVSGSGAASAAPPALYVAHGVSCEDVPDAAARSGPGPLRP